VAHRLSIASVGLSPVPLLFLLGLLLVPTLAAEAPARTDECLACHDEGEATHLDASVHAGHRCADCHPGFDEFPHPPAALETSRDVCRRCHFETYTRTLDSVHEPLVARGDAHAPSCVGCHGAHDVAPPGEPRSRVSRTCATCHAGVSRTYENSVHGHALVAEDNPDVPVCTDCHRSHDVTHPGQAGEEIHELCARCHTDAAKMERYGLSTYVVRTYLADFHGLTARFGGRVPGEREAPVTASCTDCHGVHDIVAVDAGNSPVLREHLAETCRRCHPGASESFPAAWLSHYEPSWQRAPLVYAVQRFYRIFIPFVIGGLALQILMHLWRVVAHR
jgi:predicted CXXCH cytochrome family protein